MEKSDKPEQKEVNTEVNDICKNCLFWHQFKEKCWVYWHGKKFCTVRVTETTDYEEAKARYAL